MKLFKTKFREKKPVIAEFSAIKFEEPSIWRVLTEKKVYHCNFYVEDEAKIIAFRDALTELINK